MLSQLVCASAVNGAWFGWTPGDAVTPLSLVAILETSRTKTREVVQLSQDHRDRWGWKGPPGVTWCSLLLKQGQLLGQARVIWMEMV